MATVQRRKVAIHIPLTTVFTVALGLLLLSAVWLLKGFIAVLAFAILFAIALQPLVRWFARKMPHSAAVSLTSLIVLVVLVGLGALVGPSLGRQMKDVGSHFGQVRDWANKKAEHSPLMKRGLDQAKSLSQSDGAKAWMQRAGTYGFAAVEGVFGFVLMLVLTVYLMMDGERAFAWLVAFVPRRHRPNVKATGEEVAKIIRGYARGQLITSALCSVFTFILLTVLKVPAPVPLALFAGLMDVLPVIGIALSILSAALMALTVSPTVTLIVIAAFLAYQFFENHVITPVVYGRTLDLSALAVMVAVIVGGILAGFVGAVLALPLVAAYPVIEKRWLRERLGDETVDDHVALDESEGEAAPKVIEGRPPAPH